GEHDDPRRRTALGEGTGGRDAVEARHPHVHEDHVRGGGAEPLDGGSAVGRLADDGHVGLAVHEHPEAGADHLLVVGEEDPDRGVLQLLAHKGILAQTSTPPPRRGPWCSSPPCTCTRSRMPRRPCPWPSSAAAAPRPSSLTRT